MRFHMGAYRTSLLRAMGLLPLVAACEVEEYEQPDSALPNDQLAPPPALTQPGDLFAGQAITFNVTGATPGADVYLVGGPAMGQGPCYAPLGGQCLGITNPRLFGQGTASAQGRV